MKNIKLFFLQGYLVNSFFERGIWIVYLTSMGYTMIEVGILQTILNISVSVAEVPSGILTDMRGKKTGLILGNLFIIMYMTFFAIGSSYFLLIIGHIFYGIGLSLFSGTEEAYLYDACIKEKKEKSYTKYFGRYNALAAVSLSLAMIIGGKLQTISWASLFIAGIVYRVLAIVITSFLEEIIVREEKKLSQDKVEDNKVNSFVNFITGMKLLMQEKRQVIFLIISLSLFFSGMSVFYMYNQTLFMNEGMSASTVSMIFGFLGLLQAVASMYAYYFEEKSNSNILIVLTFTMLAVVTLLLFNNLIIFVFVFAATTALYDIIGAISSNVLNSEITSEYRASILSLVGLMESLFMAILFPLIGYVSMLISIKNAMMIMAMSILILCIISLKKFYEVNSQNVAKKNFRE